jgi:hypothetical protein
VFHPDDSGTIDSSADSGGCNSDPLAPHTLPALSGSRGTALGTGDGAMIVIGVLVSAVAAFLCSSGYYVAVIPVERRALGDAAIDRGRPPPWKVLTELVRTAVVAAVFSWLATRSGLEHLPGGLGLAALLWLAFPAVLLTGSILWERVPPVTAAIHAGDWLIKLLLIAVILGLLH